MSLSKLLNFAQKAGTVILMAATDVAPLFPIAAPLWRMMSSWSTSCSHDSEKQLIRNLIKLPDVLSEVESELYPNRLCDYLFETSQKFNQFYENCSVNNAETPELKASRLSLCTVSAATIRLLMGFIGIDVVEKL